MHNYQEQRPYVFTEQGVKDLLKMKQKTHSMLQNSGCFTLIKAIEGFTGVNWELMALVDYLEEQGYFRKLLEDSGRVIYVDN